MDSQKWIPKNGPSLIWISKMDGGKVGRRERTSKEEEKSVNCIVIYEINSYLK
jgi:hypothetical protein